jgi:cytochrome c oxidase subunit 4
MKKHTIILLLLLLLLGTSFYLAHVDLGAWNTSVGLLIAIIKMGLVVFYFMRLKDSTKVHWIAASVGIFWLAILMTLTLSDYLSRQWLALRN